MLAAVAIAPRSASRLPRAPVALDTCRFIVASLYVWSGLQKLNAGFALEVVPYLSGPLVARFPGSVPTVSYALRVLFALFEVGIGVGLVTRRYRDHSVLGAAIMHLAIMVALGPWGRDWNRVILPWNAAMIAMVVVLFWRIGHVTARDIFLPGRAALPAVRPDRAALPVRAARPDRAGPGRSHREPQALVFHAIVVVLFGVMPLLSFVDAWDSYLSWSLYSGNTRRADILLVEGARQAIPPEIRRYTEAATAPWYVLAFETWSMGELNVPPYPEERIFFNVARGLCAYAGNPAGVWLRISGKPGILSGTRQTKSYACSGLSAAAR